MVKTRLNFKQIIVLIFIVFCAKLVNAQRYGINSIKGDSILQKLELLEFVSIYMLDTVNDGVSENRIAVFNKRLNKWGYVDTLGMLAVPFIYTQAEHFDNGFAFVTSRNSFAYCIWKVITRSGKELILPDIYDYVDMFQDKLFVFTDNISIYNTDGEQIIDNINMYISEYKEYVVKNKNQYRFWNHPLLIKNEQ